MDNVIKINFMKYEIIICHYLDSLNNFSKKQYFLLTLLALILKNKRNEESLSRKICLRRQNI